MVLLSPQTVFAAFSPYRPPRHLLALAGMQLVSRGGVTWAKKVGWLRNPPYTAIQPTPRQVDIWLRLARAAGGVKGQKGLDAATGLPLAAAAVKQALTGQKSTAPARAIGRKSFHDLRRLAAQYGLTA